MNSLNPGVTHIHLPTRQRGWVAWESNKRWGRFHATNGTAFTVFRNEVISIKELEAL